MNRFSTLLLGTVLMLGISACSKQKNTSFVELDEILSPTETTLPERSEQWYKDQKIIRGNVLAACYIYFTNKAINSDGTYQYEYLNNLYALYQEIPDCQLARNADIAADQDQQLSYEHQINNLENNLATAEAHAEINQAALEVAKYLEESTKQNHDIDLHGKALIDQITKQPTE